MKKKSNNGTQQLIGIKSFSRNGLLTTHGELVFYLVRPTNISVLSQESITTKVRDLTQLFAVQPDLEICCLDDCECFESNKEYLKSRIEEENNPKIRALLDKDHSFLDSIQLQMSTARQFLFMIRLRNESNENNFANLNRIEKAINEQGFDAERADKNTIKRFLSIYFGRTIVTDDLPDIDGEIAVQKWIIPD